MEKMIAAVSGLNSEIEETETKLTRLKAERSDKVKLIYDSCGKGPHVIDGKELYIFARGETWFFGGKRGKQAKDKEIES